MVPGCSSSMQLLPCHSSLQHYNAQSTRHRATAGGGSVVLWVPAVSLEVTGIRGCCLSRASPVPSEAPGLHSAVGLIAGSLGHSWKAPAGNQINTEVFLYCPCSIPPSSLLCICIHALLVIAKDPLLPPCQSWMWAETKHSGTQTGRAASRQPEHNTQIPFQLP